MKAILHTTKGDITIKFNENQTAKTIDNFITLAKKDFYNDTILCISRHTNPTVYLQKISDMPEAARRCRFESVCCASW